jgi:hypothetical protein
MFASNRLGGLGGNDLYASHRRNQRDDLGWELAESLGSGVNSTATELFPGAFEDENGDFILYFASNRAGGLGGQDIYGSVLQANGTFGSAVLIPELSSPAGDLSPTPRRDGLELFLTSDRPGTLGMNDLWISTRPNSSSIWSVPVNLGAMINTAANELAPALPSNGSRLLFHSNRAGGQGGADLYESGRTRLPGPAISPNGVVNAITYAAEPLAPNSLISIFGTNLATGTALGQTVGGRLTTNLSGTRVSFNFHGGRVEAPLLYVSPFQINAQVPPGLPSSGVTVTVTVDDATSAPQAVVSSSQ